MIQYAIHFILNSFSDQPKLLVDALFYRNGTGLYDDKSNSQNSLLVERRIMNICSTSNVSSLSNTRIKGGLNINHMKNIQNKQSHRTDNYLKQSNANIANFWTKVAKSNVTTRSSHYYEKFSLLQESFLLREVLIIIRTSQHYQNFLQLRAVLIITRKFLVIFLWEVSVIMRTSRYYDNFSWAVLIITRKFLVIMITSHYYQKFL